MSAPAWARATPEEIIADLATAADENGAQRELILSRDDSEHDALAVRPCGANIRAILREAMLRAAGDLRHA